MEKPVFSWSEAIFVYTRPRVVAMLFLGFAAGLPLLLVFSTMSAWLRELDISRSAIGFFGWIGITYSVKVFWAPVVDRVGIPVLSRLLGKRRAWMLAGQVGIVVGIVSMALVDPREHIYSFAALAVLVAFSSATQDISIDAYRIEAVIPQYQGAMSANYILGYRLAMLVAGAGVLYLAELSNWSTAYLCMAALMGVGVVTVLSIAEPDKQDEKEVEAMEAKVLSQLDFTSGASGGGYWKNLERRFFLAVVCPFIDFFQRNGRFALIILLLISLYRLSDITMGIMANPFYLDMGFSKIQIANIGKVFGFFMTIGGSFIGGILVVRYGVYRPMIAGAVMVCLTNLLFAWLANLGPETYGLAIVISADNLSGGFANAAFIAYLSGLTNRAYTATQYALFSSLMTLPGKFFSGFSGVIVDSIDYPLFFIYAALMGIPAIYLSWKIMRHNTSLSSEGGGTRQTA